jgi:hypothetical protein
MVVALDDAWCEHPNSALMRLIRISWKTVVCEDTSFDRHQTRVTFAKN